SPLGKLKNISLAIEDMGPVDLKAYNFYDGKWLSFEFESGVKVEGMNVTGIRNIQGKLMLIQLNDCTVTFKEEVLFSPDGGIFNMVVGKAIVAAYAGAADYNSFPNLYGASETLTVKQEKSAKAIKLEKLYATVRNLRETGTFDEASLRNIYDELKADYADEWLLHLEIFELTKGKKLGVEIQHYLEAFKERNSSLSTLIEEGLEMA
ncbi:MAG: phenylalanine 4-monooxygenase, partial [Bacteroidia bacterium]